MDGDHKIMEDMAELLKALAHPVRLCIVRRLWLKGTCNVTCMQECLDVSQSTVSQHLSKLRQAGIIRGERNGLEIYYSLKDSRVERILSVLFDDEECSQEEQDNG